jgi:hypothetical protein
MLTKQKIQSYRENDQDNDVDDGDDYSEESGP